MSIVTLEQIQAEHQRLAALIAQLQQVPKTAPTILSIPAAEIELQPGELYAGLVLSSEGALAHHLVLLPDEASDVSWQDALDWAASIGGELPTRQEQALLYANLKAQFQPTWYWSCQSYEKDGSCAWLQIFGNGFQGNGGASYEGRARAVRRFTA